MKRRGLFAERRSSVPLAYAASAFVLMACETLAGYELFSPPEADAGTDGSAGSHCSARPPAQLSGPELVPHEVNGRCFWMDATEVTRGDYAQFLDDESAHVTAEKSPCHENTTLEPASVASDGGESCTAPGAVSSDSDHPIVCVDWCDARAYCRWAGKSLCDDQYVIADSLENDWYAACVNGADQDVYPYGSDYDKAVCNGTDRPGSGCAGGGCTTVAAGSLQGCASVLGVRDLSGNVAEWTEACLGSSGHADTCRVRGGSFQSDSQGLACRSAHAYSRGTRHAAVGFRCCWYPK